MNNLSTETREKICKELSYKYSHEIEITEDMMEVAMQYAQDKANNYTQDYKLRQEPLNVYNRFLSGVLGEMAACAWLKRDWHFAHLDSYGDCIYNNRPDLEEIGLPNVGVKSFRPGAFPYCSVYNRDLQILVEVDLNNLKARIVGLMTPEAIQASLGEALALNPNKRSVIYPGYLILPTDFEEVKELANQYRPTDLSDIVRELAESQLRREDKKDKEILKGAKDNG